MPRVTVPQPRSGDPPRTLSHLAGGDLTRHTVIDAYEWPVPRAGIDTVFDPGQSDPYHLRGRLDLNGATCPGARVAWSIRVRGTTISSGELSGTRRAYRLGSDRRLAGRTLVAVSARRDDDRPCAPALYWRRPEATTKA